LKRRGEISGNVEKEKTEGKSWEKKDEYILEEAGERKLTFSYGLGRKMFRIHTHLSMAFFRV